MQMPFFSVIMPVYNAGKYIYSSIDSIINQKMDNFELILIDDGSMDGSLEICKEYEKNDCRIRILHTDNNGISKARNLGVSMAKGEYITFCDHDDIYSNTLLKCLYSKILKYNFPEVIKYSCEQINEWHGNILSLQRYEEKKWNIKDICRNYLLLLPIQKYVWDGVYKRKFLISNNIYFDESMRFGGEDFAFNTYLLKHCKDLVTIDECLYTHYLRVGQSTSTKYFPSNFEAYCKNAKNEYELLIKNNEKNTQEYENVFIMQKARYVIGIASNYMYRIGCDLNYRQIKIQISKLKLVVGINHHENKKAHRYLFECNKKWWVLLSLFEHDRYEIMLLIMKMNQLLRYKKL